MTWAELKAKQKAERREWLREQLALADWNVIACAKQTGMPRCDVYKYIHRLEVHLGRKLRKSLGNKEWQELGRMQ